MPDATLFTAVRSALTSPISATVVPTFEVIVAIFVVISVCKDAYTASRFNESLYSTDNVPLAAVLVTVT